ncbi:MAG: LysM peptidoglycan-binding domain-containing protein [Balneolaceae bacterium]|jgi:membrane-bound lytic murein transglycosylase D|nr:MAG: LysM peptidoglycan-binding domain-containing protein [Balneolaceae bacterium]
MPLKGFSFFILFMVAATAVFAQDRPQIERVPMPKLELPYMSPVQEREPLKRYTAEVQKDAPPVDKAFVRRVIEVYRIGISAMEAQVADNMLVAEERINEAIISLQGLMDDYPESLTDRRFNEVYRTVMAEYQDFYGISGPVLEAEGDIFAIQHEMFSANDEWFDGSYFSLPADLVVKRTEVPLIINQQVNNHIQYLTQRRPEIMQRWLERSKYYFPMMRRIFKEEGVPEELIHLSMIESGLVPTARSHARAVGLWQFMQATGSAYGLEVNWWIDERRDPEKSTRAAARHLRDLNDRWNDWHMSLANYNVSTRGMRRAITNSNGSTDYWEIYPHLPRETRGYVPGYIAATIVAMNPGEFGFYEIPDTEPYSYEVVEIRGSVDLRVLADFAGITPDELRSYNPELLRWATPPGAKPYPLKIPKGKRAEFLAAYRDMPESARQTLVIHTVSSGETLGRIASRYSTTVQALYAANERLSTTIHPGQEIIIPVPGGSNVAIQADSPSRARQARTITASAGSSAQPSASSPAPANTARLSYTVKRGDTIGHIAEWYDTQAWQIRSWNNIGNLIRAGQRLTIYVPAARLAEYAAIDNMNTAEKRNLMAQRRSGQRTPAVTASATGSGSVTTYTVRRNDNLYEIARANNTTVAELMRINNLRNNTIYVGQQLKIPAAN